MYSSAALDPYHSITLYIVISRLLVFLFFVFLFFLVSKKMEWSLMIGSGLKIQSANSVSLKFLSLKSLLMREIIKHWWLFLLSSSPVLSLILTALRYPCDFFRSLGKTLFPIIMSWCMVCYYSSSNCSSIIIHKVHFLNHDWCFWQTDSLSND